MNQPQYDIVMLRRGGTGYMVTVPPKTVKRLGIVPGDRIALVIHKLDIRIADEKENA